MEAIEKKMASESENESEKIAESEVFATQRRLHWLLGEHRFPFRRTIRRQPRWWTGRHYSERAEGEKQTNDNCKLYAYFDDKRRAECPILCTIKQVQWKCCDENAITRLDRAAEHGLARPKSNTTQR